MGHSETHTSAHLGPLVPGPFLQQPQGVHQESVLWGLLRLGGHCFHQGPSFNCLTQLPQLPSVAGRWSRGPTRLRGASSGAPGSLSPHLHK